MNGSHLFAAFSKGHLKTFHLHYRTMIKIQNESPIVVATPSCKKKDHVPVIGREDKVTNITNDMTQFSRRWESWHKTNWSKNNCEQGLGLLMYQFWSWKTGLKTMRRALGRACGDTVMIKRHVESFLGNGQGWKEKLIYFQVTWVQNIVWPKDGNGLGKASLSGHNRDGVNGVYEAAMTTLAQARCLFRRKKDGYRNTQTTWFWNARRTWGRRYHPRRKT